MLAFRLHSLIQALLAQLFSSSSQVQSTSQSQRPSRPRTSQPKKLSNQAFHKIYFVSDTNYGWGPDGIGSSTDIGDWWTWFRGPNSATYLSALYAESEQHSSYSRLSTNVSGENQIIMFKSCFPNSALQGNINDPVPSIGSNPLRGQSCGSEDHTIGNAKGIYIDLLEYFKTQPSKLFVVIAAPPLTDATYADNARAFNNWLVNDWLSGYTVGNVFVFDFYNVLTSNGGNANTNDLGAETGNHHRWWNGVVQHKTDGDNDASPNVLEYPTGDDHPSKAGNQKATAEFIPLLNNAYSSYQAIPEFYEPAVLPIFIALTLAVAVLIRKKLPAAVESAK